MMLLVPEQEWRYLLRTVAEILRRVKNLQHEEIEVMASLTQLTADVAANRSAVDSAVTLLQGLKAALDAAGTDPTALARLSADIEASTAALAAAVVANTPAAPTPTPTPGPTPGP